MNENMNETREDLKKGVSYDDPRYEEFEKAARLFIAVLFNEVNTDFLTTAGEELSTVYPSKAALLDNFEEIFADEFPEYKADYEELLADKEYAEVTFPEYVRDYCSEEQVERFLEDQDAYDDSAKFPHNGSFYEARDKIVAEWLEDHVDELHGINISVVEGDKFKGLYKNGFFPRGEQAYPGSLIPLYRLFKADHKNWEYFAGIE